MDILRKLFKMKNINNNLVIIAILGILLLLISKNLFQTNKKLSIREIKENNLEYTKEEININKNYEEILESKLEKILTKVEGVGKLKVMITLSYGREVILAEDKNLEESITEEKDAEGGNRNIKNKNLNTKNILVNDTGGNNKPIILKEIQPKVEGVIIVAEGGDNVFIKEALINSTKVVLGIESHKINILKMSVSK